jgi:cellulose synthase/poly-beta-1,6-N-acetylglucosamine synthase-like glycosyltransferase
MPLLSTLLLTFLACALCLPVALFAAEVLLSLWPSRTAVTDELPATARVAVLIPAHNEQAVLAATLGTLLPTLPPGSHLLVVADNCTDATAEIARRLGAAVVERTNLEQRGKGFALDSGIRQLRNDPPDAVVFLDADCRVAPDTVRRLAAAAVQTGRPVQGLNLCDPDPRGSPLQLVSGLAFRFKNLVRTLGLVRLAGICHLTGTGMALPWRLVETAQLAHGNVVEDMQLGIDCVLAGLPPLFLPAARVDSPLPQQHSAARTQRTRWEHGHLQTLLRQTPRLAGLALARRRPELFWLALDLAIPPLALLVSVLSLATAAAFILWLCGGSALPASLLMAACLLLSAAVLIGWAAHCRRQVPFWALAAAPLYAAVKLPIYAAFVLQRQQQWIRTQRDAPASPAATSPSTPPLPRHPTAA